MYFIQVGTNGVIAFSEPIYATGITSSFPNGAPGVYVVAPYWDDVDLRLAGNVSYEVHSRRENNPGSNLLLDQVSNFVKGSTGQSFSGSWMLVAEWKEVHPWPHGYGLSEVQLMLIYPNALLVREPTRH